MSSAASGMRAAASTISCAAAPGRQGDPGASKFFVSLEDDLMRIFGSERMDGMLQKLGLKEGEAIIHPWINKALEKAQQKVEARNYEIRKHLLRYDDVMNDQRKVVYQQRREIMSATDIAQMIVDMRHEMIERLIDALRSRQLAVRSVGHAGAPCRDRRAAQSRSAGRRLGEGRRHRRRRDPRAHHRGRRRQDGAEGGDLRRRLMRLAERSLLLQILDQTWKEHLLALDHLRQGINLRAYAQRDPLNEYKREAFELFQEMLSPSARAGDQRALPRRAARAARRMIKAKRCRPTGAAGRGSAWSRAARTRPGPAARRKTAIPRRGRTAAAGRQRRRPGRRRRATRPAPAARARNSSTATAASKARSPPWLPNGNHSGMTKI